MKAKGEGRNKSGFVDILCELSVPLQFGTFVDARQILTSNTKSPFKSKPLLPISNNRVRVKVSVIFILG